MDPEIYLAAILGSPDPTLILDSTHSIRLLSHSAESVFDVQASSVLGRSIFDLLGQASHESVVELLRNAVGVAIRNRNRRDDYSLQESHGDRNGNGRTRKRKKRERGARWEGVGPRAVVDCNEVDRPVIEMDESGFRAEMSATAWKPTGVGLLVPGVPHPGQASEPEPRTNNTGDTSRKRARESDSSEEGIKLLSGGTSGLVDSTDPDTYWYTVSFRQLVALRETSKDTEVQDPRVKHAHVIREAMLVSPFQPSPPCPCEFLESGTDVPLTEQQEQCDLAISGVTTDGSVWVSNAASRRLFPFDGTVPVAPSQGIEWLSGQWRMWDEHFEVELPIDEFPIVKVVRGEVLHEGNYGIMLPNGKKLIVFFGGTSVYDDEGTLVGGLVWARDITSLKKQEEEQLELAAAERSAEYYREVCNLMPVLMWTSNSDGHLDWWNETWHEYTDVECNDALDYRWTAYVHPEDLPRLLDAWNVAYKNGTEYNCEWRLKRKDGEWRWVAASAIPRKENGKVVKWYGLLMDMHEGMLALQKSRSMTQQVRLEV